MRSRFLQLLLLVSFVLPVNHATAQASPDTKEKLECYMPTPDVDSAMEPPLNKMAAAKPTRAWGHSVAPATRMAKAAKDTGGKITVDISKPFPKCAAVASSIDPKKPVLSATIDGDKDTNIGSPECLLSGVANSTFINCDQETQSAKTRAAAQKEKLEPEYAIINLVRWSTNTTRVSRTSSWYLYDRLANTAKEWKVSDNLRMLGSAKVGFLAVHFGIDDTCGVQYTVEAKQRTPTNVADLQQLYELAKTVAPKTFPDLSNNNSGVTSVKPPQQLDAATDFMSLESKVMFADEIVDAASPADLNKILTHANSLSIKAANAPAIGLPSDSPEANRKMIKTAARENPNGTNIVFSSVLMTDLTDQNAIGKLPVQLPTKMEAGVGIYGFATFKGIEKLPYDLTLTGKPAGTPRAVADSDQDRYAKIPATKFALFQAGLVNRDHEAPVAVSWNKEDVPVTCGAVSDAVPTRKSSLNITPASSQNPVVQSSRNGRENHHGNMYKPAAAILASPEENSGVPQNENNGTTAPTKSKSQQSTKDQPNQPKEDDQYTSKQTYKNEGLYRWDVSIGVTAFTAQKNTFSASDGTVHKSTSRPENVYAFFDFFPWKTDLVEPPPFRWKPSISGGIPAGNQPFNRSIVGTSLGFKLWGFHVSPFAGVLFLREYRPNTLAIGSKATDAQLKADLAPHHNFRPFVSINFSVKDAASLIKNKGTSQSSSSSSKSSKSSSQKSGSGTGN